MWGRDLRQRVLCSHWSGDGGMGHRLVLTLGDGSSLASTLDALITVLVVCSKVLEQLTVGLGHLVAGIENLGKPGC